jgi:putative oxidoreductase
MDRVKTLNKWANRHTSYPVDLLRIALGVFLFIKGTTFVTGSQDVADNFSALSNFTGGMFIFTYVAAAHIMGGIMIAFGLLTRWAIWAQLPILIGAVAISFIGGFNLQNLILSFVTLVICVFFLIYGSGKHSADYYFKMQK